MIMKNLRKAVGTVFVLGIILLLGAVVLNAQDVRDWFILRNYKPSEQISSISTNTSMNDKGRKLFYVHDPQIEARDEFNQDCTTSEVSLVLGCYNGVNIYIYNVSDERLKGVHEVTAAHEMLHAAYDRLSSSERKRVDELTTKQLLRLSNERIQEVVKTYRERDPKIVPNELHSILGSEVRDLDPELEDYYKQYFDDRIKVVTYSEQYEQVFTAIQAEVERYDAELVLLKAQIDQNEIDLDRKAAEINAQKAELNRLSSSGQVREYNDHVPAYNAGVEEYNREVAEYKERIREYNALVETRNSLTLEQNELIQSLDSRASEI